VKRHGMITKQSNIFLSLPVEVRHKIYSYLFQTYSGPIWLVLHYQVFRPLYTTATTTQQSDPVFATSLFRCCRALHQDAITFAYRHNSFELRGDLSAFCGLGEKAWAAIRALSLTAGPRKLEQQELQALSVIQRHCTGIEDYEIILQQESMLALLPFLDNIPHAAGQTEHSPCVILDLYLWDRHFSFDPVYRDVAWSESVIEQNLADADDSRGKRRSLLLPGPATTIYLTADVTAGAIQAIDAYLPSRYGPRCTKEQKALPLHGHRAVGGRTRYWYTMTWA
jgi:hypothetical protein